MDITLDCVGRVGVAGGQLVSSDRDRFTRSSKVYIFMGHKGRCASYRKQILLGIDGGKHLCSHQLKVTVVTNCVRAAVGIYGVQSGLPAYLYLGMQGPRPEMD